jgi:hypothetical protein
MGIFSMTVLACMELYSISLQSAGDSVEYTQAVYLAQGKMEETLTEDYLYATTENGDFGEKFPKHQWEMEIRETDQSGLSEIEVVVHWTARNKERTYQIVSLHADRDVTGAML